MPRPGLTILLASCLGLVPPAPSATPPAGALPDVVHYDLRLALFPATGRLEGDAALRITNAAATPLVRVPVVLYRLLEVSEVTGPGGMPLAFAQRVDRFQDPDRWQIRFVEVTLARPLSPGDTATIRLHYKGHLLGAAEVWPYLHDRVSEAFSLVRPDAAGYPIVSELDRLAVGPDRRFTATVAVSVPASHAVASGGRAEPPVAEGDRRWFRFTVGEPTWRLDIAAAPFRVLEDPDRGLSAHYLPADSVGAARVLGAARRAVAALTGWFGRAPAGAGFRVIEIPEGWGSQAGDGYLLQAGGAFTDSTRLGEVYHEVGHGWNARPDPAQQGTRWFDEAFASYYQALVTGAVEGPAAADALLTRYRASFRRAVGRDSSAAVTPIAEYGAAGLGGLSYTKGAWSLHVLHLALGDEAFRAVVREFLRQSRQAPATFEGFVAVAAGRGGTGVRRWAAEWLTGTGSSALLLGDAPAAELAARYR